MIETPGIYEMSADDYHADPCPTQSLSSSGAHTLAFGCPAEFDYQRKHGIRGRQLDIGTATHLLMLEPDIFNDAIVIIRGVTKDGKPSKGYSSADAIEKREEAYRSGKTPLLPEELELIQAMRRSLLNDPIGKHAFKNGRPEQSIFWQDTEFGIWRRTRPDWVPNNPTYLINLKTAASASPDDVAKAIYNLGYFQKAEWEMAGFEAVTGERPQKFCLLVISKQPPHLIVPVWLHPDDLAWGAKANRYACGVFAWCLEHNSWPGYTQRPGEAPKGFSDIRMPAWALKQLEARDERGEFEVPQIMEEAA